MDAALVGDARARRRAQPGVRVHRMASGAGHDAMIVAARMPAAMLFCAAPAASAIIPTRRSTRTDVAAALAAGRAFLDELARQPHRD